MGFTFRYSIGSDAVTPINDYATGGTVPEGAAVKLNSNGKVVVVAPGDAIFGISHGNDYATGYAKVQSNPNAAYEVPYIGTTKNSLTDADLGKLFDVDATGTKLNLDASAPSQFKLLRYDNVRKVATVIVAKRAL